MTDLIRREDAVKACKELCIDGPTDALDTGRNLGIGECINALRSIPAVDAYSDLLALRVHLAKICEAGKDLRDTAFCDVIVALDCPRGDCDCCTCEAVGKFDAAIAAARKVEGE